MSITELILSIPLISWVLGTEETSEPEQPTKEFVNDAEKQAFMGLVDLMNGETEGGGSVEPQRVVLENTKFNVGKIQEYKGEHIRKFEFRPQTFEQFIGQEQAKAQAEIIIKQLAKGMKGHLFISALPGTGKTTFVNILANKLDANLISRIGKMVEEEELINIINDINNSEKLSVLFLDEIETCNPKILKILNPIIESFEIAGKKIKPFVFACCSINKHSLIKTNPDLLDRITNHIHFKKYTKENIIEILKQYKTQLYKEETIPEEIYKTIGNNGKFNPRISIPLLEKYITIKDIKQVLDCMTIVKDGLTEKDIEILQVLNESPKPMGENALAIRVRLNRKEYALEYEPYLFSEGFINRTPSRSISKKGKQLLESLKEV